MNSIELVDPAFLIDVQRHTGRRWEIWDLVEYIGEFTTEEFLFEHRHMPEREMWQALAESILTDRWHSDNQSWRQPIDLSMVDPDFVRRFGDKVAELATHLMDPTIEHTQECCIP
jgi:hypothetical protein